MARQIAALAQLGFRMPAEWEPHEATWLAWPHEKSDWPGKFAPIPWLYGEIVRQLARVERVRILVQDGDAEESVRRILKKCHADLDAVEFFHHPTNRSWTRDYCPLFVKNKAGEVAATHWRFNGWAKYDNCRDDARTPALHRPQAARCRASNPAWCSKAAASTSTGRGSCSPPKSACSPTSRRATPASAAARSSKRFHDYLGVEEVIWLNRGIAGDDTHGHIDDLARFTSPIRWSWWSSRTSPTSITSRLKENLERLRARKDLRVTTLPMPEPVYFAGQRLPASYANFYIANRLVLVPTFGDQNDAAALRTLASVVPRPRRGRHPLPRPGSGSGHAALHDAAATGVASRRTLGPHIGRM